MKITIEEEQRDYLRASRAWWNIDVAVQAWTETMLSIDDAGLMWEMDGSQPVIVSDDAWQEFASDVVGLFRDRLETAMAERIDREMEEQA